MFEVFGLRTFLSGFSSLFLLSLQTKVFLTLAFAMLISLPAMVL